MARFPKDMLVVDVLDAHPDAAAVFRRLGYRCVDADDWCVVIEKDNLETAARLHGKPLDELLAALNGLPPAPPPAEGPAPGKPAETKP